MRCFAARLRRTRARSCQRDEARGCRALCDTLRMHAARALTLLRLDTRQADILLFGLCPERRDDRNLVGRVAASAVQRGDDVAGGAVRRAMILPVPLADDAALAPVRFR